MRRNVAAGVLAVVRSDLKSSVVGGLDLQGYRRVHVGGQQAGWCTELQFVRCRDDATLSDQRIAVKLKVLILLVSPAAGAVVADFKETVQMVPEFAEARHM
jgi:hypothetical protein